MAKYAWICADCNITYEASLPMGEAPWVYECDECGADASRDWSGVSVGHMRATRRDSRWDFDDGPRKIYGLPAGVNNQPRTPYEAQKILEKHNMVLHPHDESGVACGGGEAPETITRDRARRIALGEHSDPKEILRGYQNAPQYRKARAAKFRRIAAEDAARGDDR